MDDLIRIMELKNQGFYCSQIIIQMGLDLQGKTNPDLIRAAGALAGGIGFSGKLCGSLSGAACLLGLYAGKGTADEPEEERLNLMLLSLVEWFEKTTGIQYGGVDCDQILEGRQSNIPLRCPGIIQAVYQKSKELLVENGFDLNGPLSTE